MIYINIKDLINILPEMLNLFLPGFVFMCAFTWFSNHKFETSITILWSLFISVLIQSIYSIGHSFILKDSVFLSSFKIVVYSLTGFVLAPTATFLAKSKPANFITTKLMHKTTNHSIFDDTFDYKCPMRLRVYLKGQNIIYIGQFSLRDENDSWISLIDYIVVDNNTFDIKYDSVEKNEHTSVLLNLKDVDRIETLYGVGSETWEKIHPF